LDVKPVVFVTGFSVVLHTGEESIMATKVQSLTTFLRQTLLPAVTAAFAQPGVVFLGNRDKNEITLDQSLRLAIGPPIPSSLTGQGVWGLYELPNTSITRQMYDLQSQMASNAAWTPAAEEARLLDPEEPENIEIVIVKQQSWVFDNL